MTQVAIVVTDASRALRTIASMREGYEGPIDLYVSSAEVIRQLEMVAQSQAERFHATSPSVDAHLQVLDDGDDDVVMFADGALVMADWKDALDEAIDQAQIDLGSAPLVALTARDEWVKADPDLSYGRIRKPVASVDVIGLFVPAEHREALAAAVVLATPGESFGSVARRYVNETDGAELVVAMPEIILGTGADVA